MSGKIIFLVVMAFVAGFSFLATGFYFLSKRFLQKLNESVGPAADEKAQKHNNFRAKGCGYVSLGIGALTLVFAIFILMIPQIAVILSLVYMILLIFAFGVMMILFR
ncbi:MAG: hypothetical protein MJ188_05930 [Treponema sp.]|nr:hypothetical protein [Treponema sp.]